MSSITGVSFIKSGTDDSVVLLGTSGTKLISEFGGGTIDDSNYVKKTGQDLQIVEAFIRKRKNEEESNYGDYLISGELNANYVDKTTIQSIGGTKTLTSNITASGFAKTGKDDTSVLLTDGEIIPELTKVFPVHPVQAEYVGKLPIGTVASRNTAFQVDFSGTQTKLEVQFNGIYTLSKNKPDNATDIRAVDEKQPISSSDEVIMKHDLITNELATSNLCLMFSRQDREHKEEVLLMVLLTILKRYHSQIKDPFLLFKQFI
ncbi:MAG: hypothetical protein EZS28_005552 [Streblomastix strix]|uniref:Uncharacterized protein n=1 Tax=Streblomastix strix TaxID=222440 RepID=A0A5J4WVF9_9EUKA|nr:MAG: hypothetical protein EZS28_005552 [Streblomastix strix]